MNLLIRALFWNFWLWLIIILMPLEIKLHAAPHLKGLINGKTISGQQYCGSTLTNIALVRALRIWVAQRMYWHTLPNQDLCHILVKMSIFWKFFFAFFIVKSLSEYVVKILALKFESKKSYGKKTKFSLCKNALIGPDLA